MKDTRCKNYGWTIQAKSDGNYSYEAAQLAVLMDIRDELQTLNMLLNCPNFLRIPRVLDKIDSNTRKPRRKAKAKK